MAYVKRGPFVNASPAGPYLDAGFFNNLETELTKSANSINAVTGMFHADDYGAKFDGSDDRAAIQAAIDAAHTQYVSTGAIYRVYLRGIASVGITGFYDTAGAQQGVCCVCLRSGVVLYGPGGLKALPHVYGDGAQFAVVRMDAAGVRDAGLHDITVHGDRTNQITYTGTVQGNNIAGLVIDNVRIVNVKCYEANGNGIILFGTGTAPATDVIIQDCRVKGCNTIGIQVSQFNNIVIHNNVVESTIDNGIDVYGENGGSTTSNGINFRITNNTCRFNGIGIFPETVAHGLISANVITNATSQGIHVNRINGQPQQIHIVGNEIYNCPDGMGFTGDMDLISVRSNSIYGFSGAGIRLGGAANVSGQIITDNTMYGTSDVIPLVLIATGTVQLSKLVHMRTFTNSTNRAYDTVNFATTTANVSWQPALTWGQNPAVGQ